MERFKFGGEEFMDIDGVGSVKVTTISPKEIYLSEVINGVTMKIRYHREKYPALPEVKKMGNFIDLYSAEQYTLKKGEFALINLGISIELPEGYWAQIVPRSSTYKKYKVIQTNSFGVIDSEYCGDDDIVMLPVYATEDTVIPANERICQFTIYRDTKFDIEEVDKLEGPNRGGFGSTGRS